MCKEKIYDIEIIADYGSGDLAFGEVRLQLLGAFVP